MKKRSITRVPNTLDADIVTRIKTIPKEDMRAYAAFVYLFGSRVSEALGLQETEETGEYYEYEKTNKRGTKKVRIMKSTPQLLPNGEKKWIEEPLKAWAIEKRNNEKELWVVGIPTFKTANRPPRDVWAICDGPGERDIVDILYTYVLKKRAENPDAVLFDFTRQSVYNNFRRYLGINAFPHKLRDLRATKDATTYGLDAKDLQEKFNWARPDMAMFYGRKNKTDIIGKMNRSVRQQQNEN